MKMNSMIQCFGFLFFFLILFCDSKIKQVQMDQVSLTLEQNPPS